jgi:hypothetical protein
VSPLAMELAEIALVLEPLWYVVEESSVTVTC